MGPLPRILSIKQVCSLIGRDRRTLWAWVKDGRFPEPLKHPTGSTIGWPEAAYQQWVESLRG